MAEPLTTATALEDALHRLSDGVDALRQSLATSRVAFVRASSPDLEQLHREHTDLAARVHALEEAAGKRRSELCAAAGLPDSTRMGTVLRALPAAAARRLAQAADRLRAALHALRVEGAVGRRLLDVNRRAQEGMLLGLVEAARRSAHRYDRHARTVRAEGAGGIVRGTV